MGEMLTEGNEIMNIWKAYFEELLDPEGKIYLTGNRKRVTRNLGICRLRIDIGNGGC